MVLDLLSAFDAAPHDETMKMQLGSLNIYFLLSFSVAIDVMGKRWPRLWQARFEWYRLLVIVTSYSKS